MNKSLTINFLQVEGEWNHNFFLFINDEMVVFTLRYQDGCVRVLLTKTKFTGHGQKRWLTVL